MIVLTVGALELILMIQSARVCVGGWPAGQKRGHAIASTAGLARGQVERVMIHKARGAMIPLVRGADDDEEAKKLLPWPDQILIETTPLRRYYSYTTIEALY